MGRMNIGLMRYLQGEHFRVLIAIEMGMKNHELVPLQLISSIAGYHRGAVSRTLSDLQKNSLVLFTRGKRYDGYRITNLGYDFLALKALCSRGVVGSVGNQIGVGKESDVYIGGDPELNDVVLKFHRLGRVSFRKLKEKRDYLNKRKSCSWLYLARLAAAKEFAFLKALHDRKFPVPRPLDVCRHLVVMGFIEGVPLSQIYKLDNASELYDKLMCLVVRFAKYGLIHGDFNEFNLMIDSSGEPIIIDFPQMVSMDHANAQFYFERDVNCVRTFFKRRFGYESELYPEFEAMKRKYNLDVELAASGFTKQMAKDLNAAFDAGDFGAHMDAGEGDSSEEEDAEGTSSGEEEGQEDDDEETDSGDDHESDPGDEYEDERLERERMIERAKTSDRFAGWLEEARENLAQIVLEEGLDNEQCPELVSCKESTESEQRVLTNNPSAPEPDLPMEENKEDGTEKEEAIDRVREVNSDVQNAGDGVNLERAIMQRGKVTQPRSVYSSGSTFAPEDIKKRIVLEQRAKQKTKIRVKGKANAVRRGRKTNFDVIKEYAGWDF